MHPRDEATLHHACVMLGNVTDFNVRNCAYMRLDLAPTVTRPISTTPSMTKLVPTIGRDVDPKERTVVFSFIEDIPCIKQHIRTGVLPRSRQGPGYQLKYPALDATLWRYMDLAKFTDLLESKALFFARANKLEDPFEGSWPDASHKQIEQDTKNETDQSGSVALWRAVMKKSKEERCFTMVNCWHKSSHESEAMWKLYAKSGFEVAIKTDFKSLVHSFTCRLPDMFAKVEYIPYESEKMPWSPWAPFLHKRLGFEHEKEVRAVITCTVGERTDRFRDENENGIHVQVDPMDLIQEVVVSPYAEDRQYNLARLVCERYKLDERLRASKMKLPPNW